MSTISFDQPSARPLRDAAEWGDEVHVSLVLPDESPRTRAVRAALELGETPDPARRDCGPRREGAFLEYACRLLRLHAGEGGVCAADHLEHPSLAAMTSWEVGLATNAIHLLGYLEDTAPYYGVLDYDRYQSGRPWDRHRHWGLSRSGPSLFDLPLGGGEVVRVFGRDGEENALAVALVSAVAGQPAFSSLAGGGADWPLAIRVAAELLNDRLYNTYRGQPVAVAEAIRALRRVRPLQAYWLEEILRNEPAFRELQSDVSHELLVGGR